MVACLAGMVAGAQDEGDTTTEETGGETPAPAPPASPPSLIDQIGDIIHLKTGGTIKGQVMAPQSGSYQVEVINGVIIGVPISQVVSIDYDPYEPYEARQLLEKARKASAEAPITSTKLSPELSSKMNAPISHSQEPLQVPFDTIVG